jgi:hypothetical protein
MQLSLVVADRDVFADEELMARQFEPGFVPLIAADIVVKPPGAARTVDQVADIVLFAAPRAHDAALVPMFLPALGVKMTVGIERCYEPVVVV